MTLKNNIILDVDERDAVLADVLQSQVLGTSNHQIQLFTYLINAKFEENLDRVKAYTIAVDAFGRPKDFDGSLDSIVRVEMFRLRANLRAYNEISEKYRLELPKASYNIRVTLKEEALSEVFEPIEGKGKKSLDWKHILLAATSVVFAGLFITKKASFDNNARQCSDILPNIAVVNKSQTYDLELYIDQVIRGAASQYSHLNLVDDIEACRGMGLPGYSIEYTVFQDETTYRSTLSAVSDENGALIATQNLTGDLESKTPSEDTLSDELYYNLVTVVNDWVKPGGIIHRHTVKSPWSDTSKYNDYRCIVVMYDSFISDSNADYKNALECLETSYQLGTSILDNLGGLVASYIEQQQGLRIKTVSDPIAEVKKIMSLIGNNWDQSVETTVAKIYHESERVDYNSQSMRDVLLTAEKSYSSNPIVLNEVAKHAGFRLGDWSYAKKIADKVKRLQSERDNSVYFVDSAYVLISDEISENLETCSKTYSENSILSNLLINACATAVGNSLWLARSEENLRKLGLYSRMEKVEFIRNRAYDEEFKRRLSQIWSTPI